MKTDLPMQKRCRAIRCISTSPYHSPYSTPCRQKNLHNRHVASFGPVPAICAWPLYVRANASSCGRRWGCLSKSMSWDIFSILSNYNTLPTFHPNNHGAYLRMIDSICGAGLGLRRYLQCPHNDMQCGRIPILRRSTIRSFRIHETGRKTDEELLRTSHARSSI